MKSYQRLSAGIGLCAMAFGLCVLVVPAVGTVGPLSGVEEQLAGTETGGILLLAGAVVVGTLTVSLRRKTTGSEYSPESRRFDRATSQPPETVTVGDVVGTDSEMVAAIEHGGPAYQTVRGQLRETVLAVYTDVYGTTEEAATRAVDSGDWCQDPVANAFLSGESGPTPRRIDQLRLFALPKRERRRRIERTITAIERVQQE